MLYLDISKRTKIKKQHNLDKLNIKNKYNLNDKQIRLIKSYLEKLKQTNQNYNLVGSSTLSDAWDRHINDSLQLSKFIPKKNSSIIDLGTGAGLPGAILSIYGYTNILLVDSKKKKIDFIKDYASENKIIIKTICTRVEKIKNQKFDYILCRAFSPLKKSLYYSLFFSKKNTSLLFLKGRNVKKEIHEAEKYFKFTYKLYPSISKGDGFIISISKFKKL
ncbi:16S rRNA (guanine(527)-N(7))-methyltransferase RsmG [Pelagibacteraceae bacterium]|nr:16S rRNA (guanine(527)-N(7))-methyltransferase RsmG [Pelagibacteraceae bacterium]